MGSFAKRFMLCVLVTKTAAAALDICDNELVTDFAPENCPDGTYYVPDATDCFPRCEKRTDCNDDCTYTPCAPGLTCKANRCVLDESSCFKYNFIDEQELKPFMRPSCLPDGSYAPVQCKGEPAGGRCFCADAEGNRIFGQELSENRDKITCACSRRRSELVRAGRADVTLHCNSRGNYEPLQCDSGSCWCAEEETGTLLHAAVPDSMMTVLPCYNRSLVGTQYLRKCDSQAIAEAKIRKEFETHGTLYVAQEFLVCDWDGAYGPYKIDKSQVICTWRDGSSLDTSTGIENLKDVNCNCARDAKRFAEAGTTMLLQCQANGNYAPVQQLDAQFYCVDSDGFATTFPNETKPSECPDYRTGTALKCPPKLPNTTPQN